MTTYYVAPAAQGGSDSNAGTSATAPKLTANGAEDIPVAARDTVVIAGGMTLRESLTVDVSAGLAYTTGTVSATNGSAVINGSGTSWLANVQAGDFFDIAAIASGTDGVTDGTNPNLQSSSGFGSTNFVDGMTVRINSKNAAVATWVDANNITLKDAAGSNVVPTSGSSLTWHIGPSPLFEVKSVDSDTQITLTEPWTLPTMAGRAYQTWPVISYIGDVTGELFAAAGATTVTTGEVRITGSDDDQTATRSNCVVSTAGTRNGRRFKGITFDTTTGTLLAIGANTTAPNSRWILEDCHCRGNESNTTSIVLAGTGTSNTFRRMVFSGSKFYGIQISNNSTVNNAGHRIEDCVIEGVIGRSVDVVRVGGINITATLMRYGGNGLYVSTALATGQAVTVRGCRIEHIIEGLRGQSTGEIIEDWNTFWGFNGSGLRNTVTAGANSAIRPPLNTLPPLLGNGQVEPWIPFSLHSQSVLRNSGMGATQLPSRDLWGMPRTAETNADIGPVENVPPLTRNDNSGTIEWKVDGRGRVWREVNVTDNVAVTISVDVRWDSNASIGLKPQIVLAADYGVAEQTATATGTGGTETLTIGPVTPQVPLNGRGAMKLWLVNRSTHSAAIAAYFGSTSLS